ncbi:MAG TPA: hypothetical protein VFR50_16095 [Casimicrobiaceae bacterium]|nr:hypothetical protein [Casimicrobiaceae bacterium]
MKRTDTGARAREPSTAAASSGAAAKLRWLTDAAVRTAVPLWLLLAGILAATMGSWPPHIYL